MENNIVPSNQNSGLELPQDWKTILDKMFKWQTQSKLDADNFDLIQVPELDEELSEQEEIDFAISQIPRIEKEMKNLKWLEGKIKDERLDITRSLTDTTKNLMYAEKKYLEKYQVASSALLPLKQKEEEIKLKKIRRANEINNFRLRLQQRFNSEAAKANEFIQSTISKMYSDALNFEGEFSIEAAESSLDETSFEEDDRFSDVLEYLVDEDFKKEYDDIVTKNWKPTSLVQIFLSELHKAFSNFEQAKKDIKKAEADRKAVEDQAIIEIGEKKAVEDLFNRDLNVVRTSEVFQKTKALKTFSKLRISDDAGGVFRVLKAFAPHIENGEKYYKGRRYFDIVQDIVKILEAMNTDGVKFDGLNFTQENKL